MMKRQMIEKPGMYMVIQTREKTYLFDMDQSIKDFEEFTDKIGEYEIIDFRNKEVSFNEN